MKRALRHTLRPALRARGYCACMVVVMAVVAGAIPGIAAAKQWQICDAKIKVVSLERRHSELLADVLKVTPRGADKDTSRCGVQAGQRIRFMPETVDYQRTLPGARWPRPGTVALLRHRYLDGECMGDAHPDAHPYACRVEHFSILN